jgi:hypothetical protein
MNQHPNPHSRIRPLPASEAGQPSRCGWFDSTYELREGLEVRELSDEELTRLWLESRGAPRRLH